MSVSLALAIGVGSVLAAFVTKDYLSGGGAAGIFIAYAVRELRRGRGDSLRGA